MSIPVEVYKEIIELQNENEYQRKEKERLENLANECKKQINANSRKLDDYQRASVLLKDLFNTVFMIGYGKADGIKFEANSGYTTPGVCDAAECIVNCYGYDLKLEGSFYTLTPKKPQNVVDGNDAVENSLAMKILSIPAEEIGHGNSFSEKGQREMGSYRPECPVHPRNCPGDCVHK